MNGPKCSLCGKEHWQRDGCDGKLQDRIAVKNNRESGQRVVQHGPTKAKGRTVSSEPTNSPGEGRRVLKGSTGRGGPAKPTRTASTERADQPAPAKAPADQAHGDKPSGGNRKPRKGGKKK